MQTFRRFAHHLTIASLASTLAFPATARAATDATVQVVDQPADRRLVLSLAAVDGGEIVLGGAAAGSATVRMPRTSIVYRFRGALVDAEGRALGGPVAWSVTLLGGDATMAHLSSARAALEIPRPYGVQVVEGEAVQLVADLPATLPAGTALRIVMEYEQAATPGSRLPVLATTAARADADREQGLEGYLWTSERDGRLVALAGASLDAAVVTVEDAVTGAVVWRTQASGAFAGVAPERQGIVRPGIRLEAGRTYRVRVEGGAHEAGLVDAPIVMVVPAR